MPLNSSHDREAAQAGQPHAPLPVTPIPPPPLSPDAIAAPAVAASTIRFCKSCGVPWNASWITCPHCDARRQGVLDVHEADAGFRSDVRRVKFAVALYFALLAVSVVTMIVVMASESQELSVAGDMAATVAMALITLGWCLAMTRDLIPLLRRSGPAWAYPVAALPPSAR